jgi:hypothetical protein
MCADSGMVLLGLDVSRLNHLGGSTSLGTFPDTIISNSRLNVSSSPVADIV